MIQKLPPKMHVNVGMEHPSNVKNCLENHQIAWKNYQRKIFRENVHVNDVVHNGL